MRHRVLIVGVGSIGERHLRCFQATGRAEVSFVEINDELRQRVRWQTAPNSRGRFDKAR